MSFSRSLAQPSGPGDADSALELVSLQQLSGDIATGITDHEAAANPHPTYLTQAEANDLYSSVVTVEPPTVTGVTTTDGLQVTIASDWGVGADGAYYESTGATAGEEALLAYDYIAQSLMIVPLEGV